MADVPKGNARAQSDVISGNKDNEIVGWPVDTINDPEGNYP
jgi:hypothetical protein